MDKQYYMVFVSDGEDWIQESNAIATYDEAEIFCEHFRTGKHYIICKILKQT